MVQEWSNLPLNKPRLLYLVMWPVLRGDGVISHEQRQPYNPHGEGLILSGDGHVFVLKYTMG